MALSREEVLHVAELARRSLRPKRSSSSTRQLNDIRPMWRSCKSWTLRGWASGPRDSGVNAFREG